MKVRNRSETETRVLRNIKPFYQVDNMKHIYQLQRNSALVDVIKGFWYKV